MAAPLSFGLVRETLPRERRVALTPSGAEQLIAAGHDVYIQTGAGEGAGFRDDDYRAASASVCLDAREPAAADVLLKIHAPVDDELVLLREGGTVAGFLHLASRQESALRQTLRTQHMTAIAFELLEEASGGRPVLEPLSAIGGRVAIHLAARHLLSSGGGQGRLLGGAPGVPPLDVVVLGAGAAGEAAAREAQRLGARVTVLDHDPQKLSRASHWLNGIATVMATGRHLDQALSQADVIVCAVGVAGRPAPKIVTRKHLRSMPKGALLIDMSVDEGGAAETSRPTTPDDPIYEEEGVRHLCIPNLPAEVARTASHVFTQSVLPYLLQLGEHGIDQAIAMPGALQQAAVYHHGNLKNSIVAELTGETLDQ